MLDFAQLIVLVRLRSSGFSLVAVPQLNHLQLIFENCHCITGVFVVLEGDLCRISVHYANTVRPSSARCSNRFTSRITTHAVQFRKLSSQEKAKRRKDEEESREAQRRAQLVRITALLQPLSRYPLTLWLP